MPIDSTANAAKQRSALPYLGWVAFASWLVTFVLGYLGPGGFLSDLVEGMDSSPKWPVILFGLSGLVSAALTAWWAWRRPAGAVPQPAESGAEAAEQTEQPARRRFLVGGAALTGGVVGSAAAIGTRVSGWATVTSPALSLDAEKTSPNPRDEWQGAQVRSYRPLGSTGFNISDISFGATQFRRHPEPAKFLRQALERGVNYVDTSPDYGKAQSELIIGEVAGDFPRDELFLATKFCTTDGHLRQGSSVQDYMRVVDDSLQRLKMDYVDLVHVHACDTVARLMDPNVHEAFDRLKEQGKVRFMGVSTHTPNLAEVANTAIDSKRFDVMMLAYHHGAWPQQMEIVDRAAAQGMGIVAMKTLKGAKHKGLDQLSPNERDSFTQAAFKWVLANPSVSGLVISFHENQHLDEYLYASGQALTAQDVAVLDKYDGLIAGTHCFQHCGDCLGSCPSNVPIHDVLRHRMYFEDYGDQKTAMELYAAAGAPGDVCATCAAPCENACPQGIDIKTRVAGAHDLLTLVG